jgi:hypothetical protein
VKKKRDGFSVYLKFSHYLKKNSHALFFLNITRTTVMISLLTTPRGTFRLDGFSARLSCYAYHFISPLGIGFGVYGLVMGLYQQNDVVLIAAFIALTTALSLRLFVELIFEKNGKAIKPIKMQQETIMKSPKIAAKDKQIIQ